MPKQNEKEYLTTSELMDYISCSRSTVDRMVKSRVIKRYKLNTIQKSKIFYKKSEVQELFKAI